MLITEDWKCNIPFFYTKNEVAINRGRTKISYNQKENLFNLEVIYNQTYISVHSFCCSYGLLYQNFHDSLSVVINFLEGYICLRHKQIYSSYMRVWIEMNKKVE